MRLEFAFVVLSVVFSDWGIGVSLLFVSLRELFQRCESLLFSDGASFGAI